MKAVATKRSPPSRLKEQFDQKLAKEIMSELGLKTIHEVPRLEKIVVSVGLGKAGDDKKLIEVASNTIAKITAQKPVATIARKSIASFKLREGSKIGVKVTLRSVRMYEFADRLINIVLPRVRDFRGVSISSFDKQGNYNLGFSDQSVFPELSFEDTATPHGIQVVMVIKSKGPEHSRILLEKLGIPFEREKK